MKRGFETTTKPSSGEQFSGGKGASIAQALSAQQTVSASIPSIYSPPIPTSLQVGPQSLNFQTIVIAARQKYPVQIKGDYIFIEGITYNLTDADAYYDAFSTLKLRTDSLQTPVSIIESWREIKFTTPYKFIEFENTSQFSVTITLWSGFGSIRRDRGTKFKRTKGLGSISSTPQVVAKNHLLSQWIRFYNSTSLFSQNSRIRSATLSNTDNGVFDWDVSLWLFAGKGSPFPFVATWGAGFDYSLVIANGLSAGNALAKIDFNTPVTGDAMSRSQTCFKNQLDIPIIANGLETYSGNNVFSIYGLIVTNKAYNFSGADIWEAELDVEYS